MQCSTFIIKKEKTQYSTLKAILLEAEIGIFTSEWITLSSPPEICRQLFVNPN